MEEEEEEEEEEETTTATPAGPSCSRSGAKMFRRHVFNLQLSSAGLAELV